MTSTMKKSYIKQLLTRPRAKFTLKLPIIPEEGSDKNFLIEQLEATERLIDEMLFDYWKTPFIYPTYTSFLDYFLQLSDEYTTEILNNRYIFQKMPRSYQYKTPNVPHYSATSSSPRYSPSHHFAGHYITPESFADAVSQ